MSEEREPVRLRDDPNEDRGLRDMLDAARGETASDAMLDRVLAGVLASGGGGGGGGGSGSAAAKVAAGLGTLAVGAGVIALALSSSSSPSLPRALVAVDAAIAIDGWSEPDAPIADAGTDAFVTIVHVTPRSFPPPPTLAVPIESDGALLMRATRDHDAAASLALALEHRARFPTSVSSEDREALIVLDLARLNRSDEARTSAETFFARWPRSADRSRIETALARMH